MIARAGETLHPPWTHRQIEMEEARLKALPPDQNDAPSVLAELTELGKTEYGGDSFVIVTVRLDALTPGVDGWHSCDNFKPEMIGLPSTATVITINQNRQRCATHPEGYVRELLAMGQVDITGVKDAEYKGERLRSFITQTLTVNQPSWP